MSEQPQTVRDVIAHLVAGERSTGQDWVGAMMEAQGHVHFNSLWLAFAAGQAGMALDQGNSELALEMVKRLDGDIDDLEAACAALVGVARSMAFNAQQTIKGAAP